MKRTGKYIAKSDGTTYTYEITWERSGPWADWTAKVFHNGALILMPSGTVSARYEDDVEHCVTSKVEAVIEQGSGLGD